MRNYSRVTALGRPQVTVLNEKLERKQVKGSRHFLKYQITFPFILDVISDIQIDGDICTNSGRPVFTNVGFGNLNDSKSHNRLSHACPTTKYDTTILRLPEKNQSSG